MSKSTLRVRAVPGVLVPRFDLERDRRFVGRVPGEVTEEGFQWVATEEPAEIPDMHEFRAAVKAGDLEAADEETARKCGVAWKGPSQ